MSEPTRIGSYPIERELGRGGMGVVYLGRDTGLDRAVAIKVLPGEFASDPDRLARFEREAKLLASLHHPNIAGIYGTEEANGQRYLVLQYIEGETLGQRLGRGHLPVDDALEICRQIASALEAAHEGGVIHRDLKPGNVKITPSGEVKVLDFGLAKSGKVAESSSDPDISHSPTLTYAATGVGMILGTAAYMSPEQARGKAVDKRTDIWSFGCVLYECLTGQQLFAGETVSDTIAKILEREPDWSVLPPPTPAKVRELLQRCLEKDAKKRLRDIGDARIELEAAMAARSSAIRERSAGPTIAARARGGRGVLALVALGVLAGAVAGILIWNSVGPVASLRTRAKALDDVSHLSISAPSDLRLDDVFLTPDGTTVVAMGRPRKSGESVAESPRSIYTRRLDGYDVKPLPGTEGVQGILFSRDSKSVIFSAPIAAGATKRRLARVPLDGSAPPITIATIGDNWEGITVLSDGDCIVTMDQGTRWVRVPANGGDPGPPRKIDAGDFRGTLRPLEPLPGNRAILMNGVSYGARGWYYRIGLLDLETGQVRFVIDDGGNAKYLPTGHLLFTRGDVLLAAPFDEGRLKVTGPPVPILSGLLTPFAAQPAQFRVGSNGTLMYQPGGAVLTERRLALFQLPDRVTPWSDERRAYAVGFSLSRNGRKVAVSITNPQGIDEVWVSDVDRPALRRVVAVPDADCYRPTLSPDGSWIAYIRTGRDENDGTYLTRADGQGNPTRIVKPRSPSEIFAPSDWSPSGDALVGMVVVAGRARLSVLRNVIGAQHPMEPAALKTGLVDEALPSFSGDGRMITFSSNETGKIEAYVCAYHDGVVGPPVRISTAGGTGAGWMPDGRSVVFGETPDRVKIVRITESPAITAGTPTTVTGFEKLRFVDIHGLPDGRFLGIQASELERNEFLGANVILDFFSEVERKTRGK